MLVIMRFVFFGSKEIQVSVLCEKRNKSGSVGSVACDFSKNEHMHKNLQIVDTVFFHVWSFIYPFNRQNCLSVCV